jgi:hypothetical protein
MMAKTLDGKSVRLQFREMGRRAYRRPYHYQAYAYCVELRGKRHYLRLDTAIHSGP